MHRKAITLTTLMVLPAAAYLALLTYLFINQHLPIQAAFLGSYGVAVGMITVAGLPLARMFFDTARSPGAPNSSAFILAGCYLSLVGLYQVMRWAGDFSERVLGPNTSYLDLGFCLGAVMGLGAVVAMWADRP